MAKLEVILEGNSKGLSNAMGQAAVSVKDAASKINKGLSLSKAEIEAWDAAARKAANRSTALINPKLAEQAAAAAKASRLQAQSQLDLANSTQRLGKTMGSTNGVAIEFSRIIQDAPYGIQGVANNIQQLTQSLAYASRGAGGFGTALKASFASLVSPMNLVVLGISAVTAGWTLYSRHSQKAKKDTDDTKLSFDEFVRSLESVRGAMIRGEADAQKQLASMDSLYRISQDVTIATNERRSAVEELQKQFPDYFGNLTQEQILNGAGAESYARLSIAMKAMAQARAINNKLAENSIKLLQDEARMQDLVLQKTQLNKEIAENRQAGPSTLPSFGVDVLTKEGEAIQKLTDQLKEVDKEMVELGNSTYTTSKETENLNEAFNKIFEDGKITVNEFVNGFKTLGGEVSKGLKEAETAAKDLYKVLRELNMNNLEQSIENSISDLARLQIELDKIYGTDKGFDPFDLSHLEKGKGVTTSKSLVAPENVEIVNRVSKFFDDVYDKSKDESKQEIQELDRALSRAIDRASRDLYKTITGLGDASRDIHDKYAEGIANATGRQKEFLIGLRNQELAIATSFESIFSTITQSLNESMNDVFLSVASNGLKDALKSGVSDLKGATGKLTVAAGLVGGALSGMISKTSAGGQGAAGAISGASTGLLAGAASGLKSGNIIGAVLGGITGLLGGIFGAKRAKKQEELARQQLIEQKKQTALMERQNALAWGSEIRGRHIEGVGVVNSLELNEHGVLTTSIKGEEIEFVLERSRKSKRNGS